MSSAQIFLILGKLAQNQPIPPVQFKNRQSALIMWLQKPDQNKNGQKIF